MAKRSGSKHNKTSKRNKIRRNRTLRGGLTGVTVDQLRAIAQRRYNEKIARLERERALRKFLDEEQDDLLNPRKKTEQGSIKSTALATLFGP
jgi:hypothetical protein